MKLLHDVITPQSDFGHDIMLVRLNRPARITDTVRVVGLPTEEPRLDSTCYTSAWARGYPNKPKKPVDFLCLELRVISNDMCVRTLGQMVNSSMLCAGYSRGITGICQSDSGDPLICNGTLQGIALWNKNPCVRPRSPSWYTSILPYVKWIKATMAANP
ncbi:kallikrein-2-like [Nycticebus coucang]|uniref:kallikrein-2-like n=1 Tax=Nycticebus coucang TaxID=9470 RepID=UPI00234CC975|nr:kallikrein-2-like [Nycticebus coucang]